MCEIYYVSTHVNESAFPIAILGGTTTAIVCLHFLERETGLLTPLGEIGGWLTNRLAVLES